MDFSWSDDQLEFREMLIEFARNELNGDMIERDRSGSFDRQLWRKCAEVGIQGLPVPEKYGGQGADALTTVLALEALGYGSTDNGLIFSINAHMWSAEMPILRFGSDEQKERYLPPLVDGSMIGVQGMTEPGSGSDAFSLATRAELVDDHYVLNGSKVFITNAPVADIFIVFASTNPKLGSFGLSAILVDRDAPGLTVGKPFDKMGLRTSPMSELFFDDCRVPATNLLGRPGNGMAIFNHSIDWERACILASTLGTMQRQIETSVEYSHQRVQFDQPISKFQAVSHRLVDMQVRLEAARMLLYRAAWAKDQAGGGLTTYESAMAKLFVSEAYLQTCLDAQQIHGGMGYMRETELEREVRDAISSRIYSGTSDIQRNIIGQAMGI